MEESGEARGGEDASGSVFWGWSHLHCLLSLAALALGRIPLGQRDPALLCRSQSALCVGLGSSSLSPYTQLGQ